MSRRRVVVTGMGIVSCVGSQIKDAWRNILEGNSGISSINTFDTSQFSTRIGGLVKDFDVLEILTSTEARKMDPFIHYGIGASSKALSDSGLEISEENNHRIGVAMGAGIGGLLTIEQNHQFGILPEIEEDATRRFNDLLQ